MTFDEYVCTRGPALIRLARLLTGDDHRAEDLVQEVLEKAYVRWRRIARADRPDLYVRRMLVNAEHSWWRRRSNQEVNVAAIVERAHGDDLGTVAAEQDAMWRLISTLPRMQRAVLVLRYYEDLDDASIVEILGCSASTVRSHARRALITLRERYAAAHPTTTRSPL